MKRAWSRGNRVQVLETGEACFPPVLGAIDGQRLPVHIHIAEQVGEVQDCEALRGARPVEWLLANAEVDADWTLVHATHADATERALVVASGACVALCPLTEAYLGDGLFVVRNLRRHRQVPVARVGARPGSARARSHGTSGRPSG